MTTQFPSALDNFTNPTPSDNLNTPAVLHSDQHANENDAIEAIEAWVGISGSLNPPTHEYRLRQLEGNSSGTSRLVGWNKGVGVGTGTIFNVTETDLTLSRSGTVLELSRTTGTTFYLGVNGSRVWAYRASGTWLILTNSPDPEELIGVYNLRNGVPVGTGSMGTGTWIDWGNNLSVSMSGTTLRVNAAAFPQEVIGIYGKDEGQNVGTGTILNVVGDNVSLSLSGTTLTLSHTNPTFPQELIGLYGQDEGVGLGTGTILNVTGENVQLSLSGTVLNLHHTNPVVNFPQDNIGLFGKDEGQPLGTGTTLNVVGENISLSLSGTTLTIEHANPTIAFLKS